MAQQNDDYISFEKALRDLELQSEELKKLVSEGEIRAFRDGDSMKFRREDLESLRTRQGGDELVFAESLEDDAGMQTEELSDEDTLLADDDDFEEDRVAPRTAAGARAARAERTVTTSSRSRVTVEDPDKEPGWVVGVVVVSSVLMLYGFMQAYSIAQGTFPSGLMGMWAPE